MSIAEFARWKDELEMREALERAAFERLIQNRIACREAHERWEAARARIEPREAFEAELDNRAMRIIVIAAIAFIATGGAVALLLLQFAR